VSEERQAEELLQVQQVQREWMLLRQVKVYAPRGWVTLKESWWKVSEERQASGLLQVKALRERMPLWMVIYAQRG
jgi:hypothetical protein